MTVLNDPLGPIQDPLEYPLKDALVNEINSVVTRQTILTEYAEEMWEALKKASAWYFDCNCWFCRNGRRGDCEGTQDEDLRFVENLEAEIRNRLNKATGKWEN